MSLRLVTMARRQDGSRGEVRGMYAGPTIAMTTSTTGTEVQSDSESKRRKMSPNLGKVALKSQRMNLVTVALKSHRMSLSLVTVALRERPGASLSEYGRGGIWATMTSNVTTGDKAGQSTAAQIRRDECALTIFKSKTILIVGNHEGLLKPADGAEASKRELPSHNA
jgi:hypothetical protein